VAIDQHGRLLKSRSPVDASLLSPELALVDPELAQLARAALGAPGALPAGAGRAGTFRLVFAPPPPASALAIDLSPPPALSAETALPVEPAPDAVTAPVAPPPLRRPVVHQQAELAPAPTFPLPEPARPRRTRRIPRPIRSAALVLSLLAAITALSSVAVSRPELLPPEPRTRPDTKTRPKARPSSPAAASAKSSRDGRKTTPPRIARPKQLPHKRPATSPTATPAKRPQGGGRTPAPAQRTPRPAERVPVTPAKRVPPTPPPSGVKQRLAPRRLTWGTVAGARKYDVRLYRGGTLVFHKTVTAPAVDVPVAWRYQGQRQSLVPGRYTWYVWAYRADGRTLRRPPVVQATLTIVPN
jgi:hypothetical protein